MIKNRDLKNALYIGSLCFFSYLAVYIVRSALGAVTPQMIEAGYAESYIGKVSSAFFMCYACGQLINGCIGDRVKSGYMISFGLLFAGIANYLFFKISGTYPDVAILIYGLVGFFLSMVYGPMTKVVAENTTPVYASRCSVGYNFASFFGTPVAGFIAAIFVWQIVFFVSSGISILMALICFVAFFFYEKKGIVTYNKFIKTNEKGGSIKVLLKRQIVKFTFVSVITGIIRTTVVFWMPTYFTQHLGYTPQVSATIYTVATVLVSFSAFIAVFVFEKLKRNTNITLLIMFVLSAVFFLAMYFVKNPVLNIGLIVLAVLSSNCAASILWSVYCPSLCDTGMVSGATGYLDFMSYMAAAASSAIFANAVTQIGWGNLILVWCAIMIAGVFTALPYDKILSKKKTLNV